MLRRAEGCWGRAGDRRNESVRTGRGTPHPRKVPGAAGGSCPQRGKRRKESPPWRKRQTPPRKTTLGGSCGPSAPGLPRRAVSSSSSSPPAPLPGNERQGALWWVRVRQSGPSRAGALPVQA